MTTQLIRQHDAYSCGIACLQMLAGGMPREAVEAALEHTAAQCVPGRGTEPSHKTSMGVDPDEMVGFAWKLGRRPSLFTTLEFQAMRNRENASYVADLRARPMIPATDWLKREVLPHRQAILGVPSLNVPGVGHFVYWNGSAVFDPTIAERRYVEWSDIGEIYCAVVMMDPSCPHCAVADIIESYMGGTDSTQWEGERMERLSGKVLAALGEALATIPGMAERREAVKWCAATLARETETEAALKARAEPIFGAQEAFANNDDSKGGHA